MVETECVTELRQSVDELREEVRVLRTAIDELREVIEWISRNPEPSVDQGQPFRRIVSMPLDPTCPDFGERINAVSPADLSPQEAAPPRHSEHRVQRILLSDEHDS